jgi:hypothetical protein
MTHLKIQTIVHYKKRSKVSTQKTSRMSSQPRGGKANQRTRSYYGKDGIQRFHVKHIEPAVLEQAKQFLESYLFDLRIRQMLPVEKIDAVCSREKLFILANEQRFEPGFLVFMKNQVPLFLQNRLQYGFALRMRVQPSLYEQGTIMIATMDTVHTTLRIEDVCVYAGQNLTRSSFRERFAKLQQFFQTSFVADEKLSGCSIVSAEIRSLSEFQDLVGTRQYHSLDLIPEQGGRRRWHIPLVPRTQDGVSRNIETKKEADSFVQNQPTMQKDISENDKIHDTSDEKATEGWASKVVGSPDTMDLTSHNGQSLGRAAVQSAELSISLRKAFQGKPAGTKLHVRLGWLADFGRYEIIGLQI